MKYIDDLKENENVERLTELLHIGNDETRWKSAWALGELTANEALDDLIWTILKDKNQKVRRYAAIALCKIGDEDIVSDFTFALKHRDEDVRQNAAWVLGELGYKDATDSLVEALEDPIPKVRWHAAIALGKIGDEESIKDLVKTLDHGDEKEVLTGLDIVKDAEVELKDGNAYLFKEKKSNIVFDAGLERMRSFGEGLIITRTNPKKIKQIYDLDELSVDVYWLSKMGGEKTLDPVNLELIADLIIRYYEGGGKTVILDGIDSLLKDNSFKRFEGFIDNIVDVVSIEEGAFLTGLDPKIISERKLATIENKLTSLSFDQTR